MNYFAPRHAGPIADYHISALIISIIVARSEYRLLSAVDRQLDETLILGVRPLFRTLCHQGAVFGHNTAELLLPHFSLFMLPCVSLFAFQHALFSHRRYTCATIPPLHTMCPRKLSWLYAGCFCPWLEPQYFCQAAMFRQYAWAFMHGAILSFRFFIFIKSLHSKQLPRISL